MQPEPRRDVVTHRHPGGPAVVANADCSECRGTGKTYPFRFSPNTYKPCSCVRVDWASAWTSLCATRGY